MSATQHTPAARNLPRVGPAAGTIPGGLAAGVGAAADGAMASRAAVAASLNASAAALSRGAGALDLFAEGWTYSDIAERLGIPRGTIGEWIRQAKRLGDPRAQPRPYGRKEALAPQKAAARALLEQGGLTHAEIARRCGLSRTRVTEVAIEMRRVAALALLKAGGMTYADIARQTGMSPSNVQRLGASLGLSEPKAKAPKPGAAGPARVGRKCLRCGGMFASAGPHNRMCQPCRSDT